MKNIEQDRYQRTKMQKNRVLELLRNQGCRITKQRLILLDIILNEECSCCKELYYKAYRMDRTIGKSTVYRMVNLLEEIGAIDRKNMYKVSCDMQCDYKDACVVEVSGNQVYHLNAKQWNEVIREGLRAVGYIKEEQVEHMVILQA